MDSQKKYSFNEFTDKIVEKDKHNDSIISNTNNTIEKPKELSDDQNKIYKEYVSNHNGFLGKCFKCIK